MIICIALSEFTIVGWPAHGTYATSGIGSWHIWHAEIGEGVGTGVVAEEEAEVRGQYWLQGLAPWELRDFAEFTVATFWSMALGSSGG